MRQRDEQIAHVLRSQGVSPGTAREIRNRWWYLGPEFRYGPWRATHMRRHHLMRRRLENRRSVNTSYAKHPNE
jgi:hypothetical protein